MLSQESFVLMLVYVDSDWLDIAGNKYPKSGVICAKQFSYDVDITKGLYGIPWGQTKYFVYETKNDGHWFIVKIEKNENLLRVNSRTNRYKFKNGIVVHSGTLRTCANYIIRNKTQTDFMLNSENVDNKEIAGSTKWVKEYLKDSNLLYLT